LYNFKITKHIISTSSLQILIPRVQPAVRVAMMMMSLILRLTGHPIVILLSFPL
jgi:hypothetical protein